MKAHTAGHRCPSCHLSLSGNCRGTFSRPAIISSSYYVDGNRAQHQSHYLDGVEQRRLLRFRYNNRERIVEPHDYGVHNGIVKLFGFQVRGSSSQKLRNWRWMEQDLISQLELLDRTFPAERP